MFYNPPKVLFCKRSIFDDKAKYARFVFTRFVFMSIDPIIIIEVRLNKDTTHPFDIRAWIFIPGRYRISTRFVIPLVGKVEKVVVILSSATLPRSL